MTTDERFWSKVAKTETCWLWQAGTDRRGYGYFSMGRKRGHVAAYRLSYEWAYGPIPEGAHICHRCDNPGCVRPSHLFAGSRDENMEDMRRKGRSAAGLKNGSSRRPDCSARGDSHGARLHPERLARGDRHWSRLHPDQFRAARQRRGHITPEQLETMRSRYAAGENTQTELGAEYGIAQCTVSKLVRDLTAARAEAIRTAMLAAAEAREAARPTPVPPQAKFWSRVVKSDGCWEWMGTLNTRGYGVMTIGTKQHAAHRLSYEWSVGPIPKGMFICHRCDNRKCCNPAHLFAGTHQENMDDGRQRGRVIPGWTAPLVCPLEKRQRGPRHLKQPPSESSGHGRSGPRAPDVPPSVNPHSGDEHTPQ